MTSVEITSSGLGEGEAARRLEARGRLPRRRSSRSYGSILRANTFTVPNGILLVFGVLTIAFASWRDALFLGILVANIAIGSFQEIRSKRELDRLAALVAPEAAVVVRNGFERRVAVDQVVVGDLVALSPGDQVVGDGQLVSADGLALDEANWTGESEPAVRSGGDPGLVGIVRRGGSREVCGHGGRAGQPRGAADGDRAHVSSPTLTARTRE